VNVNIRWRRFKNTKLLTRSAVKKIGVTSHHQVILHREKKFRTEVRMGRFATHESSKIRVCRHHPQSGLAQRA
jgi:hypothetical protein